MAATRPTSLSESFFIALVGRQANALLLSSQTPVAGTLTAAVVPGCGRQPVQTKYSHQPPLHHSFAVHALQNLIFWY